MTAADWGIPTPTQGMPIVPFATPFQLMGDGVADALDRLQKQTYIQVETYAKLPSTNVKFGAHATVYADPTSALNGDYYYDSGWKQAASPGYFTKFGTTTQVNPGRVIMQTGFLSGTTNSGGVLNYDLPNPFPNDLIFFTLSLTNGMGESGDVYPRAVLGGSSRTRLQTFWGSRGTSAVKAPFFAIGY